MTKSGRSLLWSACWSRPHQIANARGAASELQGSPPALQFQAHGSVAGHPGAVCYAPGRLMRAHGSIPVIPALRVTPRDIDLSIIETVHKDRAASVAASFILGQDCDVAYWHLETCRRAQKTSAYRGRPEVIDARSERRD